MAEKIPIGNKVRDYESDDMKTCLITGGIGCLVLILVGAIFSYLIVKNVQTIAVNAIQSTTEIAIDQSQLSEAQKTGVKKQIRRVANDYKLGKIDKDELIKLMEQIAKGRVLNIGAVHFVLSERIKNSQLPQEEKDMCQRTIDRVARGAIERTISMDELAAFMKEMHTVDRHGNHRYEGELTDDELLELLTEAKKLADDADVPDEDYEIDIAGELKKKIDEQLGPVAGEALSD